MLKKAIVAIGVASATAIGSKMSQNAILKKNGWVYDKTQKGWVKTTSNVNQATVEGRIMLSNMIWSLIGLCGGIVGYFCTRK